MGNMTDNQIKWENIGTRVITPVADQKDEEVFADTTEVSAIELVTPLDPGSMNDGTGTATQNAYVYGKTYQFKVTAYTDGEPENLSQIKWRLTYTSPVQSKNKVIEKELNYRGESIFLPFKDKDMCGTDVTVTAYIEDPEAGGSITHFHHNRFRWFDAKAIDQQIATRLSTPWRIDQGRTSLCGMAALYYAMAKTNSDAYAQLSKELLRTGEYETTQGYTLKPNSSAAETMYTMKPDSQVFKDHGIPEVDWLVQATTRSSESSWAYDGIETGSSDQLKAVNWPGMLKRLLKKVAGFNEVDSEDTGTGSMIATKWFGGSSLESLQEIDELYQSGNQVLLMIDADMIGDQPSSNLMDLTTDSHWVVYEGNLRFKDSTGHETTDLDKVDRVFFDVYTWGVNPISSIVHSKLPTMAAYKTSGGSPSRLMVEFRNNGISTKSWGKNYYGYIAVK